jgi:hypothetical protein
MQLRSLPDERKVRGVQDYDTPVVARTQIPRAQQPLRSIMRRCLPGVGAFQASKTRMREAGVEYAHPPPMDPTLAHISIISRAHSVRHTARKRDPRVPYTPAPPTFEHSALPRTFTVRPRT